MKVRRLSKLLGLLVLGLALVVPQGSQAAATPTVADTLKDTIDPLRHPQNSFRPNIPYATYQYDCATDPNPTAPLCNSLFDIATVKADVGVPTAPANTIKFTMTTSAPLAPNAGNPALIPEPFVSGAYSFYFQTTMQNAPQPIYTECFGQWDNFGPSANNRIYLTEWTRGSTCPSTVPGFNPATDNTWEGDQIRKPAATSTRKADKTVVNVAPHFTGDSWWGVASVEMGTVANFDTNDDGTPDFCAQNPITGQDYESCVFYHLLFGYYEGYSGFSVLEEARDAFNASAFSFSVSGSTLTASIPYAPLLLTGNDDDLLIDDAAVWPWPYGKAGGTQKMTELIGQINGVLEAGLPTVGIQRFCPDGEHFFPNGAGPAPVGKDQIVDDAVHSGTGGARHLGFACELGCSDDCIAGIFGLLTVIDWAPNQSFELRAFPRAPAYLPSADSLDCRYPIGDFPAPPVPVNIGAMPTGIDASTSPFDKPWTVKVQTHDAPATNPTLRAGPFGPVPPAPNPAPSPIPFGVVGTNTPCNYTFFFYGLHYFTNSLTPDVTMG